MAVWRSMNLNDIPGLLHIADEVHPGLPERAEVFAERVKLFPEGCLILADGENVVGYAISHPIRHRQPPALDSLLGTIAPDAGQYYIHDVAILPSHRGRGFAADGIAKLLVVAEHYETTCLVAVYGTAPFWASFRFEHEQVDEVLEEKLRGYGEHATYLVRRNRV